MVINTLTLIWTAHLKYTMVLQHQSRNAYRLNNYSQKKHNKKHKEETKHRNDVDVTLDPTSDSNYNCNSNIHEQRWYHIKQQ